MEQTNTWSKGWKVAKIFGEILNLLIQEVQEKYNELKFKYEFWVNTVRKTL